MRTHLAPWLLLATTTDALNVARLFGAKPKRADDMRGLLAPGEAEKRQAALVLARKRGFGPFARPRDLGPDERHKLKQKRLAAMVRAGHDFEHARRVIEARDIEELEEWVAQARDEPD